MSSELETNIVSVERVKEYAETTTEVNKGRVSVSVSVSVYYLATISYTSRNNKYIHKISRSGKEGHKKPQGLYEMDLQNPRI